MFDLYIGMKSVFTVLLLSLFLILPLGALSYTFSSLGEMEVRDGAYRVGVREDGLIIKTPLFSFGSLEEGGIIALLDNPYSSFSLVPSFSIASPDCGIIGSELSVFDFHLFSFFGKRRGMGVLYDTSSLSLGLVFGKKSEDCDYQKDITMRTGTDTFWCIGEYRSGDDFHLRAIASMSDYRGFSFLMVSSFRVSVIDFAFGYGHTQAFSSGAQNWYSYLKMGIKNEKAEITHSIRLARAPIYLREYRDYEYNFIGRLTFGDYILKTSISKRFLCGEEKREARFSITWKWLSFGYRQDKGSIFASFKKDNVSLEYENGKLNIAIKQDFGRANISAVFKITSTSRMSWEVTYVV